ncbi:MAG TPA: HAMP domain-containing sensor histidine kinase [Ktedonobacterales bacterium]|nr:HAMP domain-containing sensor histidine kinase [Ktedonobacterales bacterium]
MTSDQVASSSADVPITLAERLALLGQQAGLREIFLFRLTKESADQNIQLLLHYPDDSPAQHPGRGMRRALRLVAQTANPFVTVRRAPRREGQPIAEVGQATVLMIAPVLTLESSIWGALVGISSDSSATARTFHSIIQTAEQIGGQVSSWGRRASDGPTPINAPLSVGLTSPAALMHELRTPLTASSFALDVIEHARISTGDDQVQRALRTLRLALAEAAHVVQWWDERQQHGQADAHLQPLSVEAALRQSLALVSHYASRTHITIAEDTPLALADDLMLNRVFLNLIENAFRHGQPNGVLEITTKSTADAVEVRFLNEGVIPDSAFESIIHTGPQPEEPQAENRIHGFGLGIVRTLVLDMGGHVTVESDWRHWTAFTVILRAAHPESAPQV